MNAARQHPVGPVLVSGDVTGAIVEAITSLNPATTVLDRGSYVRVMSPGLCVLTRTAVERCLGRDFHFPVDLEKVMTSYSGRLAIDDSGATWTA